MSFSSEVKKEITNIESKKCCQKAELYGILRNKASLVISNHHFGVTLSTTHNFVARRIIFLFKKIYSVKSEIEAYQRQKLDFKTKYVLTFNEEEKEFLKDLGILNSDNTICEEFNNDIIKCPNCAGSLMRGLFICQGSINDPRSKGYHLELTVENSEDIDILLKILGKYGMTPKVIMRKKGNVIYLKKAEQIGDFLKLIGAVNSLFEFEDVRISNDYSNNYNRVLNCDIHNEEKSLKAAMKQIEEIEYILKKLGNSKLTKRLLDAITLRTEYPEYSLSELSEVSLDVVGKKISKSGLGHCFSDLHKIYEDLININKKK